ILELFNAIDTSTVESEHTFATFAEACATIEDYIQVLFICEKQEKYGGTNDAYTTKYIGCPFAISVYYYKCDKEFTITKSCLKYNHNPCSNTTTFSSVIRKLDQNNLRLIEKLHNDGLRMKNIFLQLKLQGLSEIEMLKNLHEDKNIIVSEFAVGKDGLIIDTTYKTNRYSMLLVLQQLSKVLIIVTGSAQVATIITNWELALMIAINKVFSYTKYQLYTWYIFKNIKNKLRREVEIDKFIKDLQKLTYCDLLEGEAKKILYWLAPYTKRNINLDLRLSQHVKSLHSKLKEVKNRITPVDDLFATLLRQLHELSQKQAYESFLHQNKYRHDEQLPSYHHGAFTGPNITQSSIFETASISNTTNYDEIKMPAIKRSHGCPTNNGCIRSADENKMSSKKSAGKRKHDDMVLKSITCVNTAENCDKSQVLATNVHMVDHQRMLNKRDFN
ncbi:6445_t:CDS:2, partial [Gigaspora margarita]